MKKRTLVMGSSLLATLVCGGAANAYNNREHQRLPDQAYQMMNIMRRGAHLTQKVSALTGSSVPPLTARPASVPPEEQALWDRFVLEAQAAPALLGQLRSGLKNPRRSTDLCAGAYPRLDPGENLADCKASELGFAVKRGWATNDTDCFVRTNYFAGDADAPEFFDELPTDSTGALLGFYGQHVDDEVGDTVMWIRPSNALMASELKVFVNDLTEFGLAIGFAPLACIFALFSGDNCWDLARDVAHQKNPLNTMDTAAAEIEREFMRAFPWVTNIDGDDWFSTTGLWHFINVEYGDGQFNRIGGMHYTQGGWRGGALETPSGIGRLDGLDYGIIVGTDLIGLTLDPDASRGVDRYQQSPDGTINRRKSDWLKSIGHTEFEPLDNLALYGWRRFQRDGDMSGLGWVLHALGDAIAPHHGIGATGWGHRPYEDFAGFAWREMFSESGANHYFSMLDTMKEAYLWWRYIDEVQGNGNSADIDVRDLITTLAYDTRSRSDWAIKNGISLFYGDGDEDVAREEYGSEAHHARRLLETGTGATLAFLIKAAQLAPTNTTPSPCACPPGSVRNIPVSPIEEDLDPSVCNPCSLIDMHEVDGRCTPACPPDRPLLNPNNRCVAVCAQGGCTGVACPNPTDLVENGACVQQCSAAAPVIVGRECRVSCPPQMKPSESSPSFCISDPKCRTFTGTRDVLGICADSCPEGLNFISDRVCVAECPAHQPVFIMQDGLGTCETNCPESRPYRASSPEPTECLTQCPPSHPVRELLSHLCLTECSADAPFHLNGTCRSVCPQDHPLHVPGQNECVAACPDSHPHLISTACHRCPPDHNWSNGECIPIVE